MWQVPECSQSLALLGGHFALVIGALLTKNCFYISILRSQDCVDHFPHFPKSNSPKEISEHLTAVRGPGSHVCWFIPFIVAIYLMFPWWKVFYSGNLLKFDFSHVCPWSVAILSTNQPPTHLPHPHHPLMHAYLPTYLTLPYLPQPNLPYLPTHPPTHLLA